MAAGEVYCNGCYVGFGCHKSLVVRRSDASILGMRSMASESRRCRRCDTRHCREEEDCRPAVSAITERIETSLN